MQHRVKMESSLPKKNWVSGKNEHAFSSPIIKTCYSNSNHWRCSYKFRKIQRETPVQGSSLFDRVARLTTIEKDTLAQMFSCEFYKIFKNPYFEEHLRTVASVTLRRDSKISKSIVDGIYISKIKENNHLLILIAQRFQSS